MPSIRATRSIIISGFMATGKSTVAPLVATRLGIPFVDTDAEIERASGQRVPDLWRDEGEARFRAREAALVDALLADPTPRVIAFGGGTATIPGARRLAADRALIVTLTASPESVVARTADFAQRPNLAVGGNPVARARELLAQRAEAYGECHLSLSTDRLDPAAVVEAVLELIQRQPLLVPLGVRSYAIDVCVDAPFLLTAALVRCAPSSLVLVSDSNVQRARGAKVEAAIRPLAARVTRIVLPPGEGHKTLASASAIWDAALGAGLDRDGMVVAVGGGVVGDLAGFAAACLLRGVRLIQVPTTLLAMVDSSVGGKTGFDHVVGKNLIGAFHQPSAVVADLDHLTTLPARERAAGLAEVAKIALATRSSLLEDLERHARALARGELDALVPIVRAAIDAKIDVVRDDERETGRRALLNLGHTVGHAIEAHGGYVRWLHGEAVALGTIAEMRATCVLGWTPGDLVDRATTLFAALGLPTRIDASDLAAAWSFVRSDKKRMGDGLRLPVVTQPGCAHIECVALPDLRGALTSQRSTTP